MQTLNSTNHNLRLQVVGTSGSGKTTLAEELARNLGSPHLELDSIYHQAGWTPLPETDFREQVSEFCSAKSWVIDGNYGAVRDILDARITHLIWLDFPRWFVMWRLLRRTAWRTISRKELWNGNREEASNWLSRDPELNILLWAWTTHGKNRVRYLELFQRLPGVVKIRIGSPFGASRRVLKRLTD